mmetsp:Transcript_69080/g.114823  ORF Transcript_69080/g.114823 Transcript_69080/m.114823 type:complete len:232 (+) Transcript_69080:81-776(+)|eukprot:CAMPEP_0119331276 /NCGR_PEP_ID=MMETSP1333-20130426/80257_1 /TAXON_ID=418940 /ORGANISM="Scyphosphaera apsteinii, Strain RCC1455" /LENGTH=231 /DNA_ID=CAMNT_0007340841 /DNA_START=61 /DNA_END=756 /DNA_ORIENTATION=+
MPSDDDDTPPELMTLSSSRDSALKRRSLEQQASTRSSKQRSRKKRAQAPGAPAAADQLPEALLLQLPPMNQQAEKSKESVQTAPSRPLKRKSSRASANGAKAPKHVSKSKPMTGLPDVVRRRKNVSWAVLPTSGSQQAPVQAALRDFVRKQLYHSGIRRDDATTLASLRPTGDSSGRYAAPPNFASVPLEVRKGKRGKATRRKKRRAKIITSTSMTALDRMAAKLMNRGKR